MSAGASDGIAVGGRPVVITGAGSGIGAALAREAVSRGAAAVAVLDVDAADAEAVAGELSAAGTPAEAHPVDVADHDAMAAVAATITERHGAPALVCANAGVGPPVGDLITADPASQRWVIEVNLIGVLTTIQTFGRHLVDADEPGWLLATGSEHALGVAHRGMASYTASKHGVLGLCDVVRGELPGHVGISVLCPGLATSNLWDATRHRPDHHGGAEHQDALGAEVMARGMDPSLVAARALDGVAAGRFLIPTHAHSRRYADRRAADVAKGFDALAATGETGDYDIETIVAGLLAEG